MIGTEPSPLPIPTRQEESPKYGRYVSDQEEMEAGLIGVVSSIELQGYEIVMEEQFLMFGGIIKMHLSMLLEVLQEVENILAGPIWTSHIKFVGTCRSKVISIEYLNLLSFIMTSSAEELMHCAPCRMPPVEIHPVEAFSKSAWVLFCCNWTD